MDDVFDDPETLAALEAAEASSRGTPSAQNGAASGGNAPKVVQPTPQALPQRGMASAVLVSTRQKGNPVLNNITSMPWEYTDTPADFVLGQTTCALFLSLKYHRLHPEYIYNRIRGLSGMYNLRVLLAMVDIDNHEEPLRELAKTSLVNNFTLILCWSAREAARYLEAFKALERADPSGIKGAKANSYAEQMQEFITKPRGVNKTDAVSLVSAFGSIRNAVNADREEIVLIPGWGEKKVERFVATVNEPFRIGRTTKKAGRDREGAGNAIRRLGTLRPEELSSLGASRGTPEATEEPRTAAKRARDDSMSAVIGGGIPPWEPDDDDEEALFVPDSNGAHFLVDPNAGDSQPEVDTGTNRMDTSQEPQLSEGIHAALAKMRKQ